MLLTLDKIPFILTLLADNSLRAENVNALAKFEIVDLEKNQTNFHFPDSEPIRWTAEVKSEIIELFKQRTLDMKGVVLCRIDGVAQLEGALEISASNIYF